MTKITGLALIVLAITGLVTTHAGLAFAAQATAGSNSSVSALDQVVGTQNQVPIQLVRGGHMGSHGSVGAWHGAGFNHFRINNARFNHFRHLRHFRHFRPFVFSYPYYSYPYDNVNYCYWDGYSWACDNNSY